MRIFHTDQVHEDQRMDASKPKESVKDETDEFLRRPEQTENRNMNLLFYGPPGTEKSELARYIGNRLQREIICKRASDVMNYYIGITEKTIKNTFGEAEREQAI